MFVYLIRSGGDFKIGHCFDLNRRMSTYKTHNPKSQLLASVPVESGVRVETRLKHHLRRIFPQVKGSREWFEGELLPKDFVRLVQEFQDSDGTNLDIFSPLEMLAEPLGDLFEGEGIPWESLSTNAFLEGMEVEWREYLQIRLEVSTRVTPTLRIWCPTLAQRLVIYYWAPEELLISEFVEEYLPDFILTGSHVEKESFENFRGLIGYWNYHWDFQKVSVRELSSASYLEFFPKKGNT